ncbi:hypothetical protein RDI58_013254 [Solanum bulbocastanum]|uniref:Uncharacterized protein n=1 Tax=Solanum bulbocastanum TaxID=147425 RepID=A0AAN8TMH5_SOLBU
MKPINEKSRYFNSDYERSKNDAARTKITTDLKEMPHQDLEKKKLKRRNRRVEVGQPHQGPEACPQHLPRHNEKIVCYVIVRGQKAMQLLESGLKVEEYKLLIKNFNETRFFGFDIQDNIDLRIKYDPSTGIYEMYFYCIGAP